MTGESEDGTTGDSQARGRGASVKMRHEISASTVSQILSALALREASLRGRDFEREALRVHAATDDFINGFVGQTTDEEDQPDELPEAM